MPYNSCKSSGWRSTSVQMLELSSQLWTQFSKLHHCLCSFWETGPCLCLKALLAWWWWLCWLRPWLFRWLLRSRGHFPMATGRLSTSVAVGIFFCYFSLHKTAASVEKSAKITLSVSKAGTHSLSLSDETWEVFCLPVLEVQKLKLTFEAVDPENVWQQREVWQFSLKFASRRFFSWRSWRWQFYEPVFLENVLQLL